MKRIGLGLAAIAAALVSLAALVAWAMPEDSLRRAVSDQVEALTGRKPRIAGSVRLVFFPVPGVRVDAVSLPGLEPSGPPLLEAAGAEGTLDFAALLTGRLQIADITLQQPHLSLSTGEDGHSWAFRGGALAQIAAGQSDVNLPLSSIRFLDGTLSYVETEPARTAEIGLSDVTLEWPSPGADLSLVGAVAWGGQTLDLSVKIADAAVLIGGGRTDIRGKLGGDLLRLAVKGTLSSDGRLEGNVGVTAPSLRRVAQWLGLRLGDGKSIGAFKLQSPAVVDAGQIALPAAELELDGNEADGALTVRLSGPRPKISGTLAAETLDISPYSADFALLDGIGGGWRRTPIDLAGLGLVDVDLRLSAADTMIDKARLGHAAASIVVKQGALEVSLGEASAYGGILKGRLAMAAAGDKSTISAALTFEDVEMSKALGDLFAFRRLEGIGKGSLDVSAVGRSMADLAASLAGQAEFSVRNGALIGFDLAEAMRRIERRPLTAALEPRSGRTVFATGSAAFVIADGVARTTDARLDNGPLDVVLGGSAGLAARDLDLSGQVSFSSSDAGPPFVLPFKIRGPWADPAVAPDTASLIRRSDAAAPLLRDSASAFADTRNSEPNNLPVPASAMPVGAP